MELILYVGINHHYNLTDVGSNSIYSMIVVHTLVHKNNGKTKLISDTAIPILVLVRP